MLTPVSAYTKATDTLLVGGHATSLPPTTVSRYCFQPKNATGRWYVVKDMTTDTRPLADG